MAVSVAAVSVLAVSVVLPALVSTSAWVLIGVPFNASNPSADVILPSLFKSYRMSFSVRPTAIFIMDSPRSCDSVLADSVSVKPASCNVEVTSPVVLGLTAAVSVVVLVVSVAAPVLAVEPVSVLAALVVDKAFKSARVTFSPLLFLPIIVDVSIVTSPVALPVADSPKSSARETELPSESVATI